MAARLWPRVNRPVKPTGSSPSRRDRSRLSIEMSHRWQFGQRRKAGQHQTGHNGCPRLEMSTHESMVMTRSEKILCSAYALVAAVALVATWTNNIAFMLQPENQNLFSWYRALYANPAVASFTNDLLLLAVVVCIFMVHEARRLNMRFVWIYVLLSFIIAVSVMFPLFLVARQIAISHPEQSHIRGENDGDP